ncbi:MAG: hypothetical protein FWC32_04315 [Firmicutes bacterium]|nr:hypothetical protein [Bacillota bacterium]
MSSNTPMYLLSYDHGGYILWGPNFEDRFRNALEWLDKYPSFKIGLDNEAFTYDKYEDIESDMTKKINEALEKYQGRLAIGSVTYGQPLSVFISEESNVRQLVYAVRTNLRYFKKTPDVYAISEHALHSQIPQLAKQTGYKAAIMRTHFMMYGYNPQYNVGYGTWVGQDGTEIPTVPTYEGQGAEFGITTMDNWALTRWPDATDLSLEEFGEKFAHISPLLASRYDDIVLQCEKLVEHVEGNPNYRWITLEEISQLFGKPQAQFSPKPNEFVVRMPWGYCGNVIWNGCRKAETAQVMAERINSFSVMLGGETMEIGLDISWENVLISQHHDIQICGLMSDYETYIPRSLELTKEVMKESLASLASKFECNAPHSLLVVNPNSWHTKTLVEREVAYPRGSGVTHAGVFLGDKPVPCSVTVLDGGGADKRRDKITRVVVRFFAELDGLSAACYSIRPVEGVYIGPTDSYDAETGTLRTAFYTIRLDSNGIRTIQKGDTTVVDGPKGALFAGVIDGTAQEASGKWNVFCRDGFSQAEFMGTVGATGIRFVIKIDGEVIRCKTTFWHSGEKIGTTIEGAEFKDNTNGFVHEDKLRFILNTAMEGSITGIRDLPFCIAETDDKYIQGNYWMAAYDKNIGLAYINSGAMCMVREGNALSLPLAYANNYVWGDRYLHGEYSHEFAILPFVGKCDNLWLHRKALEYQYPFALLPVDGENRGCIQDTVRFMETDGVGETAVLSTLYPEKGDLFARFYECAGQGTVCSPKSQFAANAGQVNLLGEDIADNCDKLEPWEIRTWKLKP